MTDDNDTQTRTDEPAADAANGTMLEVRNVEVAYNEVSLAVRGISLNVPEHAIVALLGANGAGKTTMIRAISGLLDVYDGRVREGDILLDGWSVRRLAPHKIVGIGVAQVPEGRQVFGHLTVEENLRVGASAAPGSDVRGSLDQVYELFPVLANRRRAQAGWMSGGEQQMVAIGRALMARPRLMLLDEVSLGLAPQLVESISERLVQIRDQLGAAILMVEQNAKVALDVSDYGYIMENGRIVLDGPRDKLLDNADVQEFYLGVGAERVGHTYASVKHYKRRKRWLQ